MPALTDPADAHVRQQVAALREHLETMLEYEQRPEPEHIRELNATIFEASAYAESAPLFAAARSAAVHLVVPLEPGGTSPLVHPSKATNELPTLLDWWVMWPDANPGVVVGRVSNLIALHVADKHAAERLRELAMVELHDPDTQRGWREPRDLNSACMVVQRAAARFPQRMSGIGREFDRRISEMRKSLAPPEQRWLLWSYPIVQSGQDAFDFRTRKVAAGLTLLGEGEVMAWHDARLDGGLKLAASAAALPEIPLWLAAAIGKPRSRKVMHAAREQYEADLRAQSAHVVAEAARLAKATEQARSKALAERARASAELARAEQETAESVAPDGRLRKA